MELGPRREKLLATITFMAKPLRVTMMFATGERFGPTEFVNAKAVQDAWSRAGRALHDLKEALPDRGYAPRGLQKPLRELENAGWDLGQRLGDGIMNSFYRVQDAFTNARTYWLPLDPNALPVVQLVTPRGLDFPLELLPVFFNTSDPSDPIVIESEEDLLPAAERFLGFSAIVRRAAPGVKLTATVLDNDPALPVQFIRFREKPSRRIFGRDTSPFAAEEEFLATEPALSLDGPWPVGDDDDDAVVEALTNALVDPSRRLSAGAGRAAAIAHFACHCNTWERTSDDFELVLSNERGEQRSVFFRDLIAGYGRLGRRLRQDGTTAPRAPIIMNACGSSVTDRWSALSFQSWFIDSGHPAYLGTQAFIRGHVAAEFTEALYRLLLGGFSLGEAVVLGRRELLCSAKSPLGLLYSLHGTDRLKVAVKRPDLLKGLQVRSGSTAV